MRNKTNLLWVLLFSITLFSSCKKDDPVAPIQVDNPAFLKAGTNLYFISDSYAFSDTLNISIKEEIGVDTFLVRFISESYDFHPTQYWVIDNGVLKSSFRLRDPDSYITECKFGYPVGTTWNADRSGYIYKYTIESVDETFQYYGGELNDVIKIKVEDSFGTVSYYAYYSPQIGPLGDGEFETDGDMYIVNHEIGTASATTTKIPAQTFGNLPFLKVGNTWNFTEYGMLETESFDVEITSVSANNIYTVKYSYPSANSTQYWFEDNGYLMAYEEGETTIQADPLFQIVDDAVVGYGWSNMKKDKSFFIYKIGEKDTQFETYAGDIDCMSIDVSSGFFSFQTNYWNNEKGFIGTEGWAADIYLEGSTLKSGTNKKTGLFRIN